MTLNPQGTDAAEEQQTQAEQSGSIDQAALDEISRQLDKSYDRIPKLLAHLSHDNAERVSALDRVLELFKKIDDLHKRMGEDKDALTFGGIYDMAAKGGGGDAQALQDALDANAAFAEEAEVLAQALESATFEIKQLKEKKFDELIGKKEVKEISVKSLKSSITNLKKILDGLTDLASKSASLAQNTGGKSFDERLTEEIAGINDISADQLKASPVMSTGLGKVLRKAGFAYDHKDIVTVHAIIKAVIKVNSEQSKIIETLRPMQEQLDKVVKLLDMIEMAASYKDRQSPRYQEAMAEIDNQRARLEHYAKKHGELSELERKVTDLAQQRATMQSDVDQLKNLQASLERQIKQRESWVGADFSGAAASPEAKNAHKKEVKNLEEDIQKQKTEIFVLERKQKNLEEKIEQKDTAYKELMELKQALEAQIFELKARTGEFPPALLADRLKHEMAILHAHLKEKDADIAVAEQAREAAESRLKAMEERIGIWVKDEATYKAEVEKWKKTAQNKQIKLTTGLVGGLGAGVIAGHVIAAGTLGPQGSFVEFLTLSVAMGGVVGGTLGYMEDDYDRLRHAGAAAMAGAVLSALFIAPTAYVAYGVGTTEFMDKCLNQPCIVQNVQDENGYTVRKAIPLKSVGQKEMEMMFDGTKWVVQRRPEVMNQINPEHVTVPGPAELQP